MSFTNSDTAERKVQHLEIFESDVDVDRDARTFDAVKLTHRAFPEIALDDCDTGWELFGNHLRFPLIISSMTGGSDETTKKINRNLAVAAQECGVALAVGSQRVSFDNDAARESFELRSLAPDVALIANLGAVQLNYGFDSVHCNEAIEMLEADAIYLHLNPLQEAIQPEGNTDFSQLVQRVGDTAAICDKPVILKEVGCGLSAKDIELGADVGIKYFDIAGSGGTSWARVEHHRRAAAGFSDSIGLTFQDWGISTPDALVEADMLRTEKGLDFDLFASGGLRNGLDMVKSLILGAKACGVAAPLLKPAMISSEATVATIAQLYDEFRIAMFLLGVRQVADLINNHTLLQKTSRFSAN